ncbi:type III-B CRISPR module RAMP protein Cmr1 [Paenibacillus faecalis]|uniref:type III-B CRISPR module RAMP protein Cmr1 n=1 Tax=Paenibacillus faecalis TaxID=2079532 RepID=UPI00131A5371|nr:type III-B CRISPR module RAMP protein Cmr1 [Paenibacillus faecalis]
MSSKPRKPDVDIRELQSVIKQAQSKYNSLLSEENSPESNREVYKISVVTPMFGGGSVPGNVDKHFPVRSTAIRGHLRFWWRATRGAQAKDAKELHKRETAIFGDTKQPSAVKIWVEAKPAIVRPVSRNIAKNNERPKWRLDREVNDYPYILFPYNSEGNFYIPKYDFKLLIDYIEQPIKLGDDKEAFITVDQLKVELHAALWAWINFGGVGARTRRGCGSLYCNKFSPSISFSSAKDVKDWFHGELSEKQITLLLDEECPEWATLSKNIIVRPTLNPIGKSWKEVIDAYQHFRRRANGQDTNNPKRSHWPEADSIRRLTGMAEIDHQDPITISKNSDEIAFPKAQFGLPIITSFKDNKEKQGDDKNEREPYTTQLVPRNKDRLSSPLIMKAIAINDSQGYGAFVILKQPKLNELELIIQVNDTKRKMNKKHAITLNNHLKSKPIKTHHIYPLLNYKNNPMKVQNKPCRSAIEAFLASEEVEKWKCQGTQNNRCKTYHQKRNNRYNQQPKF